LKNILQSTFLAFSKDFAHRFPATQLSVGLPEEDDPMTKKKKQLSPKYQVWIDAQKRFHLSHAHIQGKPQTGTMETSIATVY
jgi:hypothetical protein